MSPNAKVLTLIVILIILGCYAASSTLEVEMEQQTEMLKKQLDQNKGIQVVPCSKKTCMVANNS